VKLNRKSFLPYCDVPVITEEELQKIYSYLLRFPAAENRMGHFFTSIVMIRQFSANNRGQGFFQ
jgi:hypothetical protein